MIVPEFWAEGRVRVRRNGRQVTVRRFGWSDLSLADAQANGDARAAEALERILAGETLDRRERKVPYNGAEGVPIREEIVSRHGDTVITRNSYGARCLNSPNALFADVDFSSSAPVHLGCITFVLLGGIAATVGWFAASWVLAIVLGFVALAASYPIANLHYRANQRLKGGASAAAWDRITRFAERNPDWNLRVYRTPFGLRVLVTHQPFQPNDPAVREFFDAIGTDPMYVRMCLRQQCFRARVSPKPWRIGIEQHMRPRPGVWPVSPDRLPMRRAWIDTYEAASVDFAACEYIDSAGSGVIHREIAPVMKLHDDLSRATSGLPIA